MTKPRPNIPSDMNDPDVLRMALLIACIELTGEDYQDAFRVAEQLYTAAPAVIQKVNQDIAVTTPNFAPVTF